MRLMWVVFSGTDESPVVNNSKQELDSIQIKDDEWVEEFEVDKKDISAQKCDRSK